MAFNDDLRSSTRAYLGACLSPAGVLCCAGNLPRVAMTAAELIFLLTSDFRLRRHCNRMGVDLFVGIYNLIRSNSIMFARTFENKHAHGTASRRSSRLSI